MIFVYLVFVLRLCNTLLTVYVLPALWQIRCIRLLPYH